MRAQFVGPCLALAALLQATPGQSEREPRALVVLVDPGIAPLARRLHDEIEGLGLEVLTIPDEPPDQPLEPRARAMGALAAVRVTRGAGAIEMTIVDRATGKTVTRRLTVESASDSPAAELIATRTVELLRASLMELRAPHPPRGEATVTPMVRALSSTEPPAPRPAAPPAGQLSLSGGPAFIYDAGVGHMWNAWLAGTWLGGRHIGVTARMLVPVTEGHLETAQGTIDTAATQYRLGASFEMRTGSPWLSLRVEGGVLYARISSTGTATAPYVGSQETPNAWGPWLSGMMRIAVRDNFGWLVGVDAALAYPRTVVRSAGTEVATFGKPVAHGFAGLELTWR